MKDATNYMNAIKGGSRFLFYNMILEGEIHEQGSKLNFSLWNYIDSRLILQLESIELNLGTFFNSKEQNACSNHTEANQLHLCGINCCGSH